MILETFENRKYGERPLEDPVNVFFVALLASYSYTYDTVIQVFQNDSVNIMACMDPLKTDDVPEIQIEPSVEDNAGKNDFHSHITELKSHSHLNNQSFLCKEDTKVVRGYP